MPKGESEQVEQHQPDGALPNFLPMDDNEVIKPRESDQDKRQVPDEAELAETHPSAEREPRHGVIDTGYEIPLGPPGGFNYSMDDDGRTDNVQDAPGMEVDLVMEIEPDESDLKELMQTMTRDAREEVRRANHDILSVVRAMGGDSRKYKRDRAKAVRAVVSEVYSPPRVTAAIKLLPELRLIPGFALDLTTADTDGSLWDFDSKV